MPAVYEFFYTSPTCNRNLPEYHHDLVQYPLHLFLRSFFVSGSELGIDEFCYQLGGLVLPTVDEGFECLLHRNDKLFIARKTMRHDLVQLVL